MQDEVTTLEGLIRLAISNSMLSVHTSMPAIVVSVNSDGTVDLSPAVKRVRHDDSEYELPIIPTVPVSYPSSKAYEISFPMSVGDEGLLIFSERDISGFLSTGKVSRPPVLRKHDLTDAIFFPTMLSDTERPEVGAGLILKDKLSNASIELAGGNVNIIGTLIINGSPYLLHTHTGVTTGPGSSGPVGVP